MEQINEAIENIDKTIENVEIVFNKLASVLEHLYKVKAAAEFLKNQNYSSNKEFGITQKDLESPFISNEEVVINVNNNE